MYNELTFLDSSDVNKGDMIGKLILLSLEMVKVRFEVEGQNLRFTHIIYDL